MTTFLLYFIKTAASDLEISFIEPVMALPAPASLLPPPKLPINTLVSERFMALHITTVRSVPALPTRIPPNSITLLSYKKPPIAAATPVKELSKEITTGISAPPIGITKSTPYKSDKAKIKNKTLGVVM